MWFCNHGNHGNHGNHQEEEMTDAEIKAANQKYWHTPVENTPETRKEIHRKLEQEKAATEKKRQGNHSNYTLKPWLPCSDTVTTVTRREFARKVEQETIKGPPIQNQG